MSNVKWGRVVGAGIAALFVDDLFAMVPFFGWFVGAILGWVAPVMVGLLAFCVARTVAGDAAVQHGLLVGAVAGAGTLVIGLPGFALLSAVLMVIAGAAGGALASGTRPAIGGSSDASPTTAR